MLRYATLGFQNVPLAHISMLLVICGSVVTSYYDGETSEKYPIAGNSTHEMHDLRAQIGLNSSAYYDGVGITDNETADGHNLLIADDQNFQTADQQNEFNRINPKQPNTKKQIHLIPEEERRDVIKFLNEIRNFTNQGNNCSLTIMKHTGHNFVEHFGLIKYKKQALAAVNGANLLTRIWRYAKPKVTNSEYLLYSMVRNTVEQDEQIFGAANCYAPHEYKNYSLYCPYAYRISDGKINVKDLSLEYRYVTQEWYTLAEKSAEQILRKPSFTRDIWQDEYNKTTLGPYRYAEIIVTSYEDGNWTIPYFDCGGGNVWMMTYSIPVFGYRNKSYYFKGLYTIDINLHHMDINQCPNSNESTSLNIFAGSDKCHQETTKCEPIEGLGFRTGSYKCVCKDGFHFPDLKSKLGYFKGKDIEQEYQKFTKGLPNTYNTSFHCIPCPKGCKTCADDKPCFLILNWIIRSVILGLSCIILCFIPMFLWFTIHYRHHPVMKASSPVLMRVVLLGAFFLYCPQIVDYFEVSIFLCHLHLWFREIGFSLMYGALLLKTWRIAMVFKVRRAQKIKIPDSNLLKRLVIILIICIIFLTVSSAFGKVTVIHGYHLSGLVTFECYTNWWHISATILEILFLLWGVYLCISVRKAPSEFNESRLISWAIYNETLLSVLINISLVFLKHPYPSNPDVLYLVVFTRSQLTTTVPLAFLFGSKAMAIFYGDMSPDFEKISRSTGSIHRSSMGSMGSLGSNSNDNFMLTPGKSRKKFIFQEDDSASSNNAHVLEVNTKFICIRSQIESLRNRCKEENNSKLLLTLSAMMEVALSDEPLANDANLLAVK